MTTHDVAKTKRVEMYLKAVYTVQWSAPPAAVSQVARVHGRLPPSASEMPRALIISLWENRLCDEKRFQADSIGTPSAGNAESLQRTAA